MHDVACEFACGVRMHMHRVNWRERAYLIYHLKAVVFVIRQKKKKLSFTDPVQIKQTTVRVL